MITSAPLLQQVDERMDARHGDDSFGRIELAFGERAVSVEPLHGFTGAHAPPQVFLVHFGVEEPELEALQRVLRGELLDDPHEEVDAAVRAGVARTNR